MLEVDPYWCRSAPESRADSSVSPGQMRRIITEPRFVLICSATPSKKWARLDQRESGVVCREARVDDDCFLMEPKDKRPCEEWWKALILASLNIVVIFQLSRGLPPCLSVCSHI